MKEEESRNLFEGFCPTSIFWLVKNNEYIGRISIRHELNKWLLNYGGHIGYEICPTKRKSGYGKTILKLGLDKAKKMGLRKVLITCDSDNIASKKIIELNSGKFENKLVMDTGVEKLRYWIYLD